MKKRIFVILVVVLAAAAALWLTIGGGRAMWHRGEDAGVIRVSGNIETTEIELSFRVAGFVEKRLVDEGDRVFEGKPVALLDKTELQDMARQAKAQLNEASAALLSLKNGSRPEEIAQAKAAMDHAAATLKDMQAGSRSQEIKAAQAAVAQSQADEAYRFHDLESTKKVYASGAGSKDELDLAQSAYEAAVAKVKQTKENLALLEAGSREDQIKMAAHALEEAKQHYELVKKGPRIEDIQQAEAKVGQYQAACDRLQTQLGYTTLLSPVNGIVLSKNVEPGEYVAAGTPVVTVADITKVFLRAYIEEPDLAKVKVGQTVRVRNDSFPNKVYEGKIVFIAPQAEFTPKNVQTEKERVKLVFRVKIDIDNPNMELKPGMPADGEIQTN